MLSNSLISSQMNLKLGLMTVSSRLSHQQLRDLYKGHLLLAFMSSMEKAISVLDSCDRCNKLSQTLEAYNIQI